MYKSFPTLFLCSQFRGGAILDFKSEWAQRTSDKVIVGALNHGLRLSYQVFPSANATIEDPSYLLANQATSSQILSVLLKQVIEPTGSSEFFFSNLFKST